MKKSMMTLIALTVTGLSVAGLPAWAATEVDANGDGVMTLDEVQAVYPEITAETFASVDMDADGALSDEEMVAAQEKGIIPSDS